MSQDAEIDRILAVFKLNAYAVLNLTPGVPESDIKKTYRNKSLLIHPDKTDNPKAPEAFDRLKKAQTTLMDEKLRAEMDEYIADARMLLMRERKLTADDEETRGEEFAKAWRDKTTWVIMDEEKRKRRQMEAQMREEGREQRKQDEEAAERKRKREHEEAWEKSRDVRINSWRTFQKGNAPDAKKKKKKMKVMG
jgi:DnaJ family protein C protein 8